MFVVTRTGAGSLLFMPRTKHTLPKRLAGAQGSGQRAKGSGRRAALGFTLPLVACAGCFLPQEVGCRARASKLEQREGIQNEVLRQPDPIRTSTALQA